MTGSTQTDVLQRNPFPGLRPFNTGEEHLFFGREKQTDDMIDQLSDNRFLAVIGSSGSGKSSLVNCGLKFALHAGLMTTAGPAWRIAQCRPGSHPVDSLALALSKDHVLFDAYDDDAMPLKDIVDANLRMSKLGIIDLYEQARLPQGTNLLIVIDQFEELFRFTDTGHQISPASSGKAGAQAREENTAFVNLLLEASRQTQYPIYIIITMRSDFLGDCTSYDGLAEAINQGQYLVPRLNREERRNAIAAPVEVSGKPVDPLLLTRLVNDSGDDPDQLSILQHALNRIWANSSSDDQNASGLSLKHYQSIGSIDRALDLHAEEAFAELKAPHQQRICERLFKALTNKSTDSRGIRRPTKFATLMALTGANKNELTTVIDTFRQPSRSFLMPPVSEPLEPDTTVDISHESLMRMWRRLNRWADQEAASTQIYQRLAETSKLHGAGKAGLWRDPDLQLALEWRMNTEPNSVWASRIAPGYHQAMAFLDESRAHSDVEKEQQLKAAQQERDLERSKIITKEQERRIKAQELASRRQKHVFGLILGGLIVTGSLLFFARHQNNLVQQKTNALNQEYESKTTVNLELIRRDREHNTQLREIYNNKITVVNELIKRNRQTAGLLQAAPDLEQLYLRSWDVLAMEQQNNSRQAATLTLHNATENDLLILSLNEHGYQTNPVLLPSRSQLVQTMLIRQIWVARSLPQGRVIDTGVLQDENNNYTIKSIPEDTEYKLPSDRK